MRTFFAFNGDADGLTAVHQLMLAEQPGNPTLITSVKRDTRLLAQLVDAEQAAITALDIEFDKNLPEAQRLLEQGCHIRWFDHHRHQSAFQHPNLSLTIENSPVKNTAILVCESTGFRHPLWAVVGAYGDNLSDVATAWSERLGLSAAQTAQLRECGELMNYNAYGQTLADLHYSPLEILEVMSRFDSPLAMLAETTLIESLRSKYREDLQQALAVEPRYPYVYVLPEAPWSRRIIGELANTRIRQAPDRPVAIALETDDNAYVVSVRSPATSSVSALALCQDFATGGGRVRAAGINRLPADHLSDFVLRFHQHYGVRV